MSENHHLTEYCSFESFKHLNSGQQRNRLGLTWKPWLAEPLVIHRTDTRDQHTNQMGEKHTFMTHYDTRNFTKFLSVQNFIIYLSIKYNR